MRHGYYVEMRYFANRYEQAKARAQFLADTYGRSVDVNELRPGARAQRPCFIAVPRAQQRKVA